MIRKRESEDFLTKQVITYLGNKRSLLSFIEDAVKIVSLELGKDKMSCLDLFSGSGIVSRFLKKYSNLLISNDLEGYSKTINTCYLANKSQICKKTLKMYYKELCSRLTRDALHEGFITELYSPKDDCDIKNDERVFFTHRNAMYIDTARQYLEHIPSPYKEYLLAPLLYEVSVKNNTAGVFKGFYKNSKTNRGQFGGNGKNSLRRILADMEIQMPVFSQFDCECRVFQEDANKLITLLEEVDLAYIDPPYNQHPYGSNYFMLNLVNDYKKPKDISKVAGIPSGWNKSMYNNKSTSIVQLDDLCRRLKAKYILISFNSEGFISREEMENMLRAFGSVRVFEKRYNTYRASRNLAQREMYVDEYLFLLKKEM